MDSQAGIDEKALQCLRHFEDAVYALAVFMNALSSELDDIKYQHKAMSEEVFAIKNTAAQNHSTLEEMRWKGDEA